MTQLNMDIFGSGSLLQSPGTKKPAEPAAKPPTLRAFGDVKATRQAIYDNVLHAASTLEPVTNQRHTLALKDVDWVDNPNFTKADRKHAILTGSTMGRRLRGTWVLTDNATGKTLDQVTKTIMRVPYLTEGGTFVNHGNELAVKNQQRLKAGLYTRQKDNGELETHANVLSGGPSHRYFLDPAKGTFYMSMGQSMIPLMPLLQAMGTSDKEFRDAWGNDLYASNYQRADASAITKLKEKLLRNKIPEHGDVNLALKDAMEKMTLDPEVTQRTMGQPYDRLNKDAILAVTKKLLAVSRGEAEVDDRDHLAYQKFMGPEDLFSERVAKDRAGVRRQLLFKASNKGNLQWMGAGALQDYMDSTMMESGLGEHLQEINPAEILDKMTQVSRMGEGAIQNYEAIPDDSRMVQPSHAGFIDPVRTPENFRAGVDTYMAGGVRKGDDGKLYARFYDARSGQERWVTPQQAADSVVTWPGVMKAYGNQKRIPAMVGGKITWKKKEDVGLVLPHFEHAFSPLGNLVPLKSMVKAQRVAMASRMTTQALPLVGGESPLVQSAVPGTGGLKSYEDQYGDSMGAIRAQQHGRVVSVDNNQIKVRYDDGRLDHVELYNNFPYNRKTGLSQSPAVQVGQRFGPGDLLAKSNFTDGSGAAALGLNARVAYTPWGGMNFEDAVVISEGMAKRLKSEHMYQHQLEMADSTRTGLKNYVSLFPGRFSKEKLATLDGRGLVQPGTEVHYGDPLILAANERSKALNKVHKKNQAGFTDATITWEHEDPGVVTDVVEGKDGPVVLVKSQHAMQVGDKLSGRYGDKGVVASIVPDDQMPTDKTGSPFEILLNPLGVISRTNPAQWAEAKLGDVARKTGKPVKVEDFDENVPDRVAWVEDMMRKHGVADTEDIIDPSTGNKIPGVYTGTRFFMKLHHTAESKGQGRGTGGYSADETPAKGGETGSKRLALLDVNALLSHGATDVLRDAGAIRGQKNDDYWLQFMQGYTPRAPKVPLVYQKFVDELKASGINVVPDGSQLHIMALTDKDIDKLAGDRNITTGETVKFGGDLKPIKGGLFDEGLTGGHHGSRWAAIPLTEAMPNPVMEEPIRRVLGLTQKKFEAVLGGTEKINGETGPGAIQNALKGINLERELLLTRHQIKNGSQAVRDAAVRRLGYLKSAQRLGIHPSEWMLTRVPVLPPQFRPINMIEGKQIPLVSDANFLYKELLEADKNLSTMKQQVGHEGVGPERLAVYHAFKAVTGLGEPITQQSQEKNVHGILRAVFGSSPKFGAVQRKLISSTVDNVGRAVITPDPDLDMDSVGLPEDRAFDVYSRFVVRRLRRSGMPITRALQEVKDKTMLARKALLSELDERPVIINRAPVLHRFGIMAFKPKLVKGSTLRVPPLVVKGFGADFDGDAVQYHVPTDEDARKEALERMLPSRQLLSPADFKSPMHAPSQEYVLGLFHGSTHKSNRPVRTFRNARDVYHAWRAGEIQAGDPVKVMEHK